MTTRSSHYGKRIRMRALTNVLATATAVLCLSGCIGPDRPSSSSVAGSSGTASDGLVSPTPGQADPLLYQIAQVNGQLLLIPTPDSFHRVDLAGEISFTYLLSEDGSGWIPADYSVQKTGTVKEKDYGDGAEKAVDIYKMSFGGWSCHAALYTDDFTGSIEEYLLGELVEGRTSDILPVSKDYAILQFFNDIYSIDQNGTIQRISSHSIPPYDFDTIRREPLPDGLEWRWTYYAVCNPTDNIIYYLTSREQTSYAVWQIDLDAGTERKLCKDLALSIHCSTAQYLSIVMNPSGSSLYGKLLKVDDLDTFEGMSVAEFNASQEFWFSGGGWMYRYDGPVLVMDNGDVRISTNPQLGFTPLCLGDDRLWIYIALESAEAEILTINIKDGRSSHTSIKPADTIEGWRGLLDDLKAKAIPISDTDLFTISKKNGDGD